MTNILKKLIAVMAAITLIASVIPGVFAEESDGATVATISADQEELLRYLEVIPEWEEEVAYDRELTRGEMAHMAARIANLGEYKGDDLYFYDVPAEYEYFHDIYALFEMGVIAGDGNGFYRPDDTVSDVEICKVFSVLLGYREVGEFSSYIRTARAAGITDGVEFTGTVTYGTALKLAYNTLHCKILDAVIYGDEHRYAVNENLLAIELYHDLVPQRGVVEGIYGTTLTQQDQRIEEDTIVIDGKFFICDYGEELLGYEVVFYSHRDKVTGGTSREIQFICADEEKNQVVEIEKEDLIKKDADYLYYWVKDKEKKIKIDVWTDAIFNGVAYPSYTFEELKGGNGYVKLIDNDKDDIVDVIIEESYSYMEVLSFDSVNGILYAYEYGKNTKSEVTIGSAERTMEMSYTKAGRESRPTVVKSGAIAAVKQSRNTEGIWKVSIDILSATVTGMVETLAKDRIVVGGTTYSITDALMTDYAVQAGDSVKLYIHNGKVVLLLHANAEDYHVGMLVAAATNQKAFGSTLQIKLVDTDKELLEFYDIEKIYLDEIKYDKNMDEAVGKLEASAQMTTGYQASYPQSQFVRYRIDDSGQLTHIDTMKKENGEDEDSLQLSVPKTAAYAVTKAFTLFEKNTDGKALFSVNELKPAMEFPQYDRELTEWYVSRSVNDRETWNVEAYNVDPDTGVAEYWICYGGVYNGLGSSQTPLIITDIETALDDEGNLAHQIVGVGESGEKTIPLHDEVIFCRSGSSTKFSAASLVAQLKVGDVVAYTTDQLGKKGARIYKLFSPGDKEISEADSGTNGRIYSQNSGTAAHEMYKTTWCALGTVLSTKSGNYIRHTTAIPDDGADFSTWKDLQTSTLPKNYPYYDNGAVYYVYDSSNPQAGVTKGTIGEIDTYENNPAEADVVFMACRSGELKYVYVMK